MVISKPLVLFAGVQVDFVASFRCEPWVPENFVLFPRRSFDCQQEAKALINGSSFIEFAPASVLFTSVFTHEFIKWTKCTEVALHRPWLN